MLGIKLFLKHGTETTHVLILIMLSGELVGQILPLKKTAFAPLARSIQQAAAADNLDPQYSSMERSLYE